MVAKNHVVAGGITCAAMLAAWAIYEFALPTRVAPPQNDVANALGLTISASCLDFGEVWEDSQFKWVVSLENRSTQELVIDGFGSTCTCTDISPNSLVIPPGKARDLHLTIDLTMKSGQGGTAQRDGEDFEVGVRHSPKRTGVRFISASAGQGQGEAGTSSGPTLHRFWQTFGTRPADFAAAHLGDGPRASDAPHFRLSGQFVCGRNETGWNKLRFGDTPPRALCNRGFTP